MGLSTQEGGRADVGRFGDELYDRLGGFSTPSSFRVNDKAISPCLRPQPQRHIPASAQVRVQIKRSVPLIILRIQSLLAFNFECSDVMFPAALRGAWHKAQRELHAAIHGMRRP